jgi:hypothetical protein
MFGHFNIISMLENIKMDELIKLVIQKTGLPQD